MTTYLELEDALEQIRFLGFHVREVGLLEGSLARPRTSLFGAEAYPTLSLKGAALIHSIITSHPLIDGNKRTGWTLLITFLMLNGFELVAETEDAFTFVLSVATAGDELAVIALWIEEHLVPA
ncbi:MAG: type II toxin-antitoxin system death-on-curing family toxin [Pontimonas sp.]